jgi:low affinity Fe/Cu permease
VGGIIVMTACNEILEHDCSWQLVCLCAVGVLPLCLSFLENRQS